MFWPRPHRLEGHAGRAIPAPSTLQKRLVEARAISDPIVSVDECRTSKANGKRTQRLQRYEDFDVIGPCRMIIDADPGIDDAMAILYAVRRPPQPACPESARRDPDALPEHAREMLLRLKTCQLCHVQEGMIRPRQQFRRALDASVQHEGVRRHLERLAEGAREMGRAVASAGRERFERQRAVEMAADVVDERASRRTASRPPWSATPPRLAGSIMADQMCGERLFNAIQEKPARVEAARLFEPQHLQ